MAGVGETIGTEIEAVRPTAAWGRSRWLISGGYGWYFAGVGAYTPFAALYFRELGFSGVQVGLLSALPPLGVGLFGPVIGAVADERGMHRAVLRAALACAALLALVTSQVTEFVPLVILLALLALASLDRAAARQLRHDDQRPYRRLLRQPARVGLGRVHGDSAGGRAADG